MKRSGAPITWVCNECGVDQRSPDALLNHVWLTHARSIIEQCPWIVEALWKSAARQELQRQAVLGRKRSA
jgi:hypothetical protein